MGTLGSYKPKEKNVSKLTKYITKMLLSNSDKISKHKL